MAREQRRLAAIVAADVVGYSRLMGRDESGTLAALKALRRDVIDPPIAAHGGRIVKTTGDGLLLEFPSVVDAVRCVVEVQTAMAGRSAGVPEDRRIAFRIGVNLGDIIIDGGDIFGDGVNIAARLEGIAEPGGICLSDDAYRQIRGKIDLVCEDDGLQTLKNIAEPVRTWRWSAGDTRARVALQLPEKPSIAILPFQNMSGDHEQEYFVDGIAEDVITALSRFRELFVIARNSSFTYKGRAVDVRQVARELGVRYVLEGSSRKAANRVRVTAQLIDCESGSHLWAERYDRELSDIFAIQEEITRAIVASIAPAIGASTLARIRRMSPANLTAHELATRAWSEGYAGYLSGEAAVRDRALASARQALELDPDCARAWGAVAAIAWQTEFYSQRESTSESCRAGLEAARRAIALDRFDHNGYTYKGLLHLRLLQHDDALSDLRHACQLNPNDTTALQALAYSELMSGDAEAAKGHCLEVLRLNPRDPLRYNAYSMLANLCFLTAEYTEGLKWVAESKREHPSFRPTIMAEIKLYVGLGQLDRARTQADLVKSPDLEARIRAGASILRRPENREREIRFLRIAFGLEDGGSAQVAAPTSPLALPDKPSIAVLPFQNMSGDPEQEYFADGVVEDIITALSRFRSLFVIARNSSFSYKGKSPDIRQVGKELGVRYVLEGSIRKASNRIRVTGQLIDTVNGNHIWAERYDRVLEDIFAVQEEVTQAIVGAIAPEIAQSERHKATTRRRPENFSAYEIVLRAQAHVREGEAKADAKLIAQAVAEAEQALAIDPQSGFAYQTLAYAHGMSLLLGSAADPKAVLSETVTAATRAIELDPSDPFGYALRGVTAFLGRQVDHYGDGLADAQRAHAMNSNDTLVLFVLSILEAASGEPDRSIEHAHEVLRLNPRGSHHDTHNLLAFACFGAKKYSDGIDWARLALRERPRMLQAHLNLSVCLVGHGDISEAQAVLEAGLKLAPAYFRNILDGASVYARDTDRIRQHTFLRIAAGLKDPSAAEALR